MQGAVYEFALGGLDDGLRHPHVVVLLIGGDRECLVVPAYSAGGHRVAEHIALRRRLGDPDDRIFVRLDNGQAIDFAGPFDAKEAFWCGGRFRRLAQSSVRQGRHLGQMRPGPLLQVAECVLSHARANPHELSKNAVRNLQATVDAMQAMPNG